MERAHDALAVFLHVDAALATTKRRQGHSAADFKVNDTVQIHNTTVYMYSIAHDMHDHFHNTCL